MQNKDRYIELSREEAITLFEAIVFFIEKDDKYTSNEAFDRLRVAKKLEIFLKEDPASDDEPGLILE